MPGSIFNYNVHINGRHEARIKGLIGDVSSIIEESLANGGKSSLIPKLFVESTSNRQSEYIGVEDAIGTMHPTIDGDHPKSDKRNQIGSKRISHIIYTLDTMVTETMMEDADYGMDINSENSAHQLPDSYFNTREIIAQNSYIYGENSTYKFEGAPIDLTTYDGKPLFSSQHEYGAEDGHAHGIQSNLFYFVDSNPNAGVMAEVLAQLAAEVNQMKNANGVPQNFLADTVFTMGDKRHTKLNNLIKQATGSEYFPGTANNDINTQYGQWNYEPMPLWQGGDAEIMVMSQRAKNQNKSMFFNRKKLAINVYTDNGTNNVHWTARARWGLGHVDYKHVVRCKILKAEPAEGHGMTKLVIS